MRARARARARAMPPVALEACVATLLVVGTLVEAGFAGASWEERLAAPGPAALLAIVSFGWLVLVYSLAVRASGRRLAAGVVLAEAACWSWR